MLEEIMREIHNFFPTRTYSGEFTIEDSIISPQCITEGQYIFIEGSVFNGGVHKYGDKLVDEVFNGYITLLNPPSTFLSLVAEIEAYQAKYGDATPYTSESFGGYSYSKATGTNGAGLSWADVFRKRLNAWRKI